MQKWGKRPIYFKNAEIMQNALIMQTLRPLQFPSGWEHDRSNGSNCQLGHPIKVYEDSQQDASTGFSRFIQC